MVPTCPILDLDYPQVRIKFCLPVKMRIDLRLSGSRRIQMGDPVPAFHSCIDAGWRWSKQSGGAIQTIDLNENRTRIIVAVPYYDCRGTRDCAGSQIGTN